jgi:hypothetical protein
MTSLSRLASSPHSPKVRSSALRAPPPARGRPARFPGQRGRGSHAQIAELRAQGPAGLAQLFATFDRLPVGRERDQLARVIDQVARQRYATVSRLYWYTDLGEAKVAAQRSGRPILALRMLGNLDEELSCANSRLFRTVLYANADVSGLMRDHFILYWSSERPVPKVTIDMGDGRIIQRTTTGNSAHYVLDAQGNVLDVLPGLYAPRLFKEELTKSLALAAKTRTLTPTARNSAITAFHQQAMRTRAAAFAKLTTSRFTRDGTRSYTSKLAAAQRATMSKRVMEVPDLQQFGMDPGSIGREDLEQWATIGARLWNLVPVRPDAAQAYDTFDTRSLHLIRWLHQLGSPVLEAELAAMIGRLEYSTLADSALAELQLRQQIRAKLVAEPGLALDPLNDWIYAEVFHTPKSDPWLGLVPRTDFTGLPGDGTSRADR